MIKKYIKPLIIALTAFIALFVATGAYAGGYDLFMMPDAGKLNNPSTSVHMLYQMFGPLISDILNPSLDVNENGYLFAYMLKYWNFLIASGAGAFISYHLILAFVKSAENGKFLAGEAEKVGSILRYSLGGFFVAPVIGTGKFCAMQMLFMYGILSGVHAANLLWGTASYGIQMGVTPTIPSNLTSTINTVAGEMYLYDMVDKYTSGTIAKAHGNGKCDGSDTHNAICITTGTTQAVDLENQPGFESVGNALIDEHSYHYLHNLSGVLRLYASKCTSGIKLPNTTSGVINDPNCPAFDAWVMRHTNVNTSTQKKGLPSCSGYTLSGSRYNCGNIPINTCMWAHKEGVIGVNLITGNQAKCILNTALDPTSNPVKCVVSTNNPTKVCNPDILATGCGKGYKLTTWIQKDGSITNISQGGDKASGVCLPDMTSKQQYTKGEWVIDSGVDAINFHGPTSPESSGINIIDASDRISTGAKPSANIAGFEKAVLMDAGTPVDQSESVIVSDGGLIKSQTHGAESHGENKKEAALIAPLGMNLGAIPSNYGFPIVAQSGSPLYYGAGSDPVAAKICPQYETSPKLDPNTTPTYPGFPNSVWYKSIDECTYQCKDGYIGSPGSCTSTCKTGIQGYCYGPESYTLAGGGNYYFKSQAAEDELNDSCNFSVIPLHTVPGCAKAITRICTQGGSCIKR